MKPYRVMAIDPGPERTAWVLLQHDGFVRDFGIDPNDEVLVRLHRMKPDRYMLAIEMIARAQPRPEEKPKTVDSTRP